MNQQQFSVCEQCQRRVQIRLPHPVDPNLIHSSHIPSEAEISQALELLEKGTQELEKCDSKVAYLHGQSEEAEAEKRKLENHVASLRSISSTWRRVPVELWEHIFAFACFSSSTDGFSLTINYNRNFEKSTVTRFPVILSHVCSRWRSIVTGFPWLWSSIRLDLTRFPMGADSVLQMFLMNSARCPIVLRVSLYEVDLRWRGRTAWKLLVPHFFRCKQLTLNTHYDSIKAVFSDFRYLGVTFLDLSFLHLQLSFHDVQLADSQLNSGEDNPFWEALRQAPKLAEVCISRPYLCDLLPYHRLTKLAIGSICIKDIPQLLRILEASKELCSLSLGKIGDWPYDCENDILTRQIELPLLSNLVCQEDDLFQVDNNETLGVLFTSLVMPSILTFQLTCAMATIDLPSPLLGMLQRTSMTLRHLTFCLDNSSSSVPSWPLLSPLFKMTPHLEHFELQDLCRRWLIPDHLILSLLSDLTNTVDNIFLPALSSLILTNIGLNPDIMKGVVSLAASRSPRRLTTTDSVRGLKEIRVGYINPRSESGRFVLEPQIIEEIRRLEWDGVKVVVEETFD